MKTTRPYAQEDSESGWIRCFEKELKKLNPLLLEDLPLSVGISFYESARYTPQAAAQAYRDLKIKKGFAHGQSSRNTKG